MPQVLSFFHEKSWDLYTSDTPYESLMSWGLVARAFSRVPRVTAWLPRGIYRVPQEKFINPWCMRKGYGSRSVSLSVTTLAATYLVCESNLQCYKVSYGLRIQMHGLCGYCQKHFVHQFWHNLILKPRQPH